MPRPRDILKDAVRQIDEKFRKDSRPRIPAVEFQSIPVSRFTLARARFFLGINSHRYRDEKKHFVMYWYRGERLLQQALDMIDQEAADVAREHQRRKITALGGVATECQRYVRDFMTAEGTHYEVKMTELVQGLSDFYTRRTISRAKRALGIKSVKRRGGWWWLWPAQECADWLENFLLDQEPQPVESIYNSAHKKGWSREAIDFARQRIGLGNIFKLWHKGNWCWYSVHGGALLDKETSSLVKARQRDNARIGVK